MDCKKSFLWLYLLILFNQFWGFGKIISNEGVVDGNNLNHTRPKFYFCNKTAFTDRHFFTHRIRCKGTSYCTPSKKGSTSSYVRNHLIFKCCRTC